MKKIREVIRMNESGELSQRQISKALNLSRPIVSQYIKDIISAGLTFNDIENMTDQALEEVISGKKQNSPRYYLLHSRFEKYSKELKKTGVTLSILWEEYKKENPDGYSYTQFCYHYQVWREASDVSMRMEHKAGDKTFVDFTGKKLTIIDRSTEETKEVEVLVAVLGASGLTYVEALESQRTEDWIKGNQNAFIYFGGVTSSIVPDCLKSAVTKSHKYEPDINPTYIDFARHYDTTILPARPYHPKDKALAENAVKIVYSWIFAKMRNEVFFSLADLNKRIRELLEEYNNKLMQRPKISRRQLFNDVEKSALKPLPAEPYEIKRYKKLKVQFNYHVYLSDDKHSYSVPYRYKSKTVEVFYTEKTVEIYENNLRIALHMRNRRPNGYSTLQDHMPPQHRYMTDWNPEKLLNWAGTIGEPVKELLSIILESKKHPEQTYKTCLGILNLSKKYSKQRLVKACKRAHYYASYTCKGVENILKNNMEDMDENESDMFAALPEHNNIRGKDYYSEVLQ